MLTTFSTLDRGINLQYHISSAYWKKYHQHYAILQKQFVNKENPEKDLDGIYIEKPTHLFTYARSNNLLANTVLHFVFEQDELFEAGEISYAQKQIIIEHFFTGNLITKLSDFSTVEIAALVKIEQALGRISRVEVKNRTQNVYLDETIPELFTSFDRSKRVNGLMRSVLEKMPKEKQSRSKENAKAQRRDLNRYSNKMRYLVNIAHNMSKVPKKKHE